MTETRIEAARHANPLTFLPGNVPISQHIQRLEAFLGQRLIARDTHRVRLTPEGEALLGYARNMLDINNKVAALFGESRLRGRLRLGVSEDFVASRLTVILEEFTRLYPLVDLAAGFDSGADTSNIRAYLGGSPASQPPMLLETTGAAGFDAWFTAQCSLSNYWRMPRSRVGEKSKIASSTLGLLELQHPGDLS